MVGGIQKDFGGLKKLALMESSELLISSALEGKQSGSRRVQNVTVHLCVRSILRSFRTIFPGLTFFLRTSQLKASPISS